MIDADRLVTRVHRALVVAGYREVYEAPAAEDLVCARRGEVRLNLAGLGLSPVSQRRVHAARAFSALRAACS